MLRPFALFTALACSMAVHAASEIRPVHSWAEYHERLRADGKTGAEADADVADMLASLRAVDMGNIRAAIDRLLEAVP